MKHQKNDEFTISDILKMENEFLYVEFNKFMTLRNKQWFYLRTLAKLIFNITDGRGFGKEALEDIISQNIEQKTEQLRVFSEFAQNFLQHRSEND